MTPAYRYVQTHTNAWHAWPVGGLRSACGTLNSTDLKVAPAKAITTVLPPGTALCGTCARQVPGAVTATEDDLSPDVRAWLGVLRRHARRFNIQIARADELELAGRLAMVGPTTSLEAQAMFREMASLILTPRLQRRRNGVTVHKLVGVKEALAMLPPDPVKLRHIATALQSWRFITGKSITGKDRFQPAMVVDAILKVPAPEAYIQQLHRQGLSDLAVVFHPNTVTRRRNDGSMRGVFGGSGEYWEQTAEQLAGQIVQE